MYQCYRRDIILSKNALGFNSIARKAAEDLGLPGPEAVTAPAEEQKAEKKGSKEEVNEVNINLSKKCLHFTSKFLL